MSFFDALEILNKVEGTLAGRSSGGLIFSKGDLISGPLSDVPLHHDCTTPFPTDPVPPVPMPSPSELALVLEPEKVFVEPVPGSVVYCDLPFGMAEHSGIYIRDGQIVALESDGRIVSRSPEGFMKGTPALCIYVSCRGDHAVGSVEAAERARRKIGTRRDYNVAADNCHHFSYGCLTGDFESRVVLLTQLKLECRSRMGASDWHVWDHGDARETVSSRDTMLRAAEEILRNMKHI